MIILQDRLLGCMLGGVVGDALGCPYESQTRDAYSVSGDMEYCPHFDLPAGSFTDDTSMMLCLATSLIACCGFNPVDQMERYARWYLGGYMSCIDVCFDIGSTTRQAIERYVNDKAKHHYYGQDGAHASGNAGLMRLAPVVVYYSADHDRAVHCAELSSKVTHASVECLEAARLMACTMYHYIHKSVKAFNCPRCVYTSPKVSAIRDRLYISKPRQRIETSGYVIDSLEAALWALHHTDTFEAGMLVLLPMGGDVDTVSNIYGQIAGAYYGYLAIPQRWCLQLQRQQLLLGTFLPVVLGGNDKRLGSTSACSRAHNARNPKK